MHQKKEERKKKEKKERKKKERREKEREKEKRERKREENLNTLTLRERIKEEAEIQKGINHATIGIKVYPLPNMLGSLRGGLG